MKEAINTYEMTTPREGLTQYKFSGHGYKLSVATHAEAYAVKEQGTCEIALFDEHDNFIPLTRHDDVDGYIPRSDVDGLLRVLETSETPPFSYFHHKYETDWDE